ncbi:MAG: aromatic ring-hydroxylating dioxygenase subunit alpha [Firmicutes bacterium]|nr:aromatic ring-hydroxylating dioxygenase subunit alpha [Alicyclobacillaceae bacterium]MCL6498241.1 aromatic ring-hydroxylating dioxygenase subunit alpha [Bacillota bacterium]
MVDPETNRLLTQVGRGTPMGELLRRYWHPIAAVTEFEETTIKPVRLLGEDLVLYRDLSGQWGLVERQCPHRRADLLYGWVEECGIRCSYHGWAFDAEGRCTSQPYEDLTRGERNRRFRESIRIAAYPVREMAGLLFAYLGPLPAPELPRWELFDYRNGFAQIVFADVPCNWLQAAENNIDPVHFEWLHDNWAARQAGRGGNVAPTHLKIDVFEWEFGFGYRRILSNTDETDPRWTQPRLHLMPNIFMPGGTHFEYRVPVDDEHTLSVVWAWEAVPLDRQPYVQTRIPHWYAPIRDEKTGRWITSHVINQDTVAWVGQGPIADRSKEHLASSDIGITMFRRRLKEDLERVARGEDPSGVIRDPEKARLVRWPDNRRAVIERGLAREEWLARRAQRRDLIAADDYFIFYAGQPESVRREYEAAMGLGAAAEPNLGAVR